MKPSTIIKVNALGGIFTPLNLNKLAEIASKFGAKNLNFGPRQEIFFNIKKNNIEEFKKEILNYEIEFEIDQDIYPNIVSSYPAEGIFSGDNWLSEGIYKDIFDNFDFKPRLQINICDNDQTLVPLFTGQLNFIASHSIHYWFLYINIEQNNHIVQWNRLIYSTDIPKIVREIEEMYFSAKIKDINTIMNVVNENVSYLYHEIEKDIVLPRYVFPYYEGMNRYGNKFWLGIARRDYFFDLNFITDLSMLCMQLNIGQVCITPWRSLLIKGIEQKDRIFFEKLLGKYGINLRHSTSELNWIVSDINSDEMDVKNFLSDYFYKTDTRTFGLVFGVKLAGSAHIPASIILVQKPFFHKDDLKLMSVFDVLYAQDFNPNSINRIVFARNVRKSNLVNVLSKLIKLYYASLTEQIQTVVGTQVNTIDKHVDVNIHTVFQCKHCYTVYDAAFGDDILGIEKGTSFLDLPAQYECTTCGAPKSDFKEIEIGSIPT
jgi:rubredoxin